MFSKIFVVMAVAIVAVNAQNSTSGPSSCIVQCAIGAAAVDGCVSPTNQTCVCTSAEFQTDAGLCINDNCPSDLPAAIASQSSLCGTTTPTTSASTTHSIPFTAGANSTANATTTAGGTSSTPSVPALTSGSTAATPSASSSGASSGASATTPGSSQSASISTPTPTPSSAGTSLVSSGGAAAVLAVFVGILAI